MMYFFLCVSVYVLCVLSALFVIKGSCCLSYLSTFVVCLLDTAWVTIFAKLSSGLIVVTGSS